MCLSTHTSNNIASFFEVINRLHLRFSQFHNKEGCDKNKNDKNRKQEEEGDRFILHNMGVMVLHNFVKGLYDRPRNEGSKSPIDRSASCSKLDSV